MQIIRGFYNKINLPPSDDSWVSEFFFQSCRTDNAIRMHCKFATETQGQRFQHLAVSYPCHFQNKSYSYRPNPFELSSAHAMDSKDVRSETDRCRPSGPEGACCNVSWTKCSQCYRRSYPIFTRVFGLQSSKHEEFCRGLHFSCLMVSIASGENDAQQLTVHEMIWATNLATFCVPQVFTIILEGK
jgi:hypothetical protein